MSSAEQFHSQHINVEDERPLPSSMAPPWPHTTYPTQPPMKVAFAHYSSTPKQPDVVLPAQWGARNKLEAVMRQPEHESLFHSSSRLATLLRYGRFIACFNLYPGSRRDLEVNHLLWSVARNGEYDPVTGNVLLKNNVLALAYPAAFYDFLASVTHEELTLCILEVLAMIAEGEDAEGLSLMKQELEPSIWDDLVSYMKEKYSLIPFACAGFVDVTDAQPQINMHSHATPTAATNNPDIFFTEINMTENVINRLERDQKTMRDVEMLLRLCYSSPWKIEVHSSFITPCNMGFIYTELTNAVAKKPFDAHCSASGSSPSISQNMDITDRRLVRSTARRPVWAFRRASSSGTASSEHRQSNKKLIFWRQYQMWRMYRRALVDGCRVSPAAATEAMLTTLSNGSFDDVIARAETVMACACVRGNLLSNLPREIVFRYIAPFVLLAG